ncbi:MAG: transglycosylase SLT domain-containing protein [Candidatus Omnitrophota bacterium]
MLKKPSDVDIWIDREKKHEHIRQALENASTYFDHNDVLDVHTLEAVYGKESSFGDSLKTRGITKAAGEFHLDKVTAERYGLSVSKENDQRFDIDCASIAAARYLKDIDYEFSKETILTAKVRTVPVTDPVEREKFDLAAYNAGPTPIATAQQLAQKAGKNPAIWDDVKTFLKAARVKADKITEIRNYVSKTLKYQDEFEKKSPADSSAKDRKIVKPKIQCTKGHWITKDHHHIFICE